MGDGKDAVPAQSKNRKKNLQKKRKRAREAMSGAPEEMREESSSPLDKIGAEASKGKAKKKIEAGLPDGISREIAVSALEAFRAEFVDGAEDCFADFIDANDVSDEVEDMLWPYARKISKSKDPAATIDELEQAWALKVSKASGKAIGEKTVARKKKKTKHVR